MSDGPKKSSIRRRSFRLAPLEMMIMGLIAVGVLYLLTMWFMGSGPAEQTPASTVPRTMLERALASTDKVQAQLSSQKKEMDQALNQMRELKKDLDATPKGKGDPRFVRRLIQLEKRMARLDKKQGKNPANAKVDSRLAAMEKKLAAMEKKSAAAGAGKDQLKAADARLDKLEKSLAKVSQAADKPKTSPEAKALAARVDKLEKNLAAVPRAASKPKTSPETKALRARVEAMEKRLAAPGKSGKADVRALAARLDKLEKAQPKTARPAAAGQKTAALAASLEKRLNALEKRGAGAEPSASAAQAKALASRVDKLENKLVEGRLAAAIASGGSSAAASAKLERMEGRIAELEETLQEVREGSASASPEQIQVRLKGLERDLAKAKDSMRRVRSPITEPEVLARLDRLEKGAGASPASPDAAGLAKRVDALEKRAALQTSPRVRPELKPAPTKKVQAKEPGPRKPKKKVVRIRYKVRRGDTLYGIARRYRVKASEIRNWNPKLKKRRTLWVGERLTIYRGG